MSGRITGRRRKEPIIALINIVFLMLIFFLIAGTIAPQQTADISLVTLSDLDGAAPSETLAIYPDGRAVWQGSAVDVATFTPETGDGDTVVVRLLPDRALPAWQLIEIASSLQANGATEVRLVTERGLR